MISSSSRSLWGRGAAAAVCSVALVTLSACDKDQRSVESSVAGRGTQTTSKESHLSTSSDKGRPKELPGATSDDREGRSEQTKALVDDYISGRISATEAVAVLLNEDQDNKASQAWNEFLFQIRPTDLETFFTALREKGNTGIRAEILPALVSRANAFDHALAEILIDKLPEGSLRMNCIQSLFLGGPESILHHAEFLSTLNADRDTMALGINYTEALEKLDSKMLGDFVSALSEGRAKQLALTALAKKLGSESIGLQDLSNRLADAPSKSPGFLQEAFLAELEKHRETAYQQLSLSAVTAEQQSAFAYATATMIHRTSSPSDAMTWLWQQGSSDPGLVRKGVHDTMVRWLNSDPTEAAKWLEKQPAGPLKDVGLERLMQYLDQPEEAATKSQWASQFSDPELAKRYGARR